MSGKIMGQVWDLVLTPAKQAVLLALADHADHMGDNIKPGVPLVAWKTGYSERQVQRIMHDLEDDGLLVKVDPRPGKPTVYKIDLSKGTLKPAFVQRTKKPTGDKMTPLTPDKMSGDKLSPRQDVMVTSHGEQESQRGDIASADLSSIRKRGTVSKSSSSDETDARQVGVDPTFTDRHLYYHAFEMGFPDVARTKVPDREINKRVAQFLYANGYQPIEVIELVRDKIATGKTDYRFEFLEQDLAQKRLEGMRLELRRPPPEVVNSGHKIVPAETDWRREPAEAGK